jgi:hypothetical protein
MAKIGRGEEEREGREARSVKNLRFVSIRNWK